MPVVAVASSIGSASTTGAPTSVIVSLDAPAV